MIRLNLMSRRGFILAFLLAAPSICPQSSAPGKPSPTFQDKTAPLSAPQPTPAAPVRLIAIEPSVLYPAGRKRYTLNIIGEGFNVQDLLSYAIRIGGEQVRFNPTSSAQNHICLGLEGCLDFINPGTLQLRDFETQSAGETTFRLWTGTQWTEPCKITLSIVAREKLPWISFWALALTVLVMMAPIAIARSPGVSIREFLVDKELEVYSVAKAQFLLWSVVLIFVYADRYLAAALVQGRFDIPEIPGGFATLMAMSAFTAISSSLIGRAKRSARGVAGKPALSDFVQQFHVIQVERAHFAVWTIAMAVVVVCRVVLPKDPVPGPAAIPPIFLWLTGISAASYLCGKLVRRPGPGLREATAKPDETLNKLRFVILGSNFSPVMRFEIDGSTVHSSQCKVSALESERKAVSAEAEATNVWPTTAAAVDRSDGFVLEIASARDAWLQGTHTLRIFNADNQSVDAQYTGLAFIYRPLTAKGPVRASQDWVPVMLTGLDVADQTPIRWHDASGMVSSLNGFRRLAEKETPGSDSTKETVQWTAPACTIEVSLRPGLTTGFGCLMFVPQDGKQFAVPVEVQ
jgi:hypothetical protein